MRFQLEKKIVITGEIIALSGIMVGGSSSALEIGGTDKQVIRNPINKMPYIPGSSIKGKMRSLIELKDGTINTGRDGSGPYGPTHDPKHIAARLFGHIKNRQDNNNNSQQASRIIVRDAELNNSNDFKDTELLYTEVKAENTIDRITSAANPRFFERVPKGAKFTLNIIVNVFSHDGAEGEKFLDYTYDALKLVQDDYLGGGGSRGNGQIAFNIKKVVERGTDYYTKGGSQEKDLSADIPPILQLEA